jgi:hypothetical protein
VRLPLAQFLGPLPLVAAELGDSQDAARAPNLLERILDRLPDETEQGNPAYPFRPSRLEQRFLLLVPVLTMLRETVESPDWDQNQLAVRIFIWIAKMYKAEIDHEAG